MHPTTPAIPRRRATATRPGLLHPDTLADIEDNTTARHEHANLATLDVITGIFSADANGWEMEYRPSGKKVWKRRWLALVPPASINSDMVSAAALPVGVATLAAVDPIVMVRTTGGTPGLVNATPKGAESATTLTVNVATADGSNLSVASTAINIFVWLEER